MTSVRHTVQNPPDGGWGWIIVSAAFLTFFMTTGTMMSLSVMFVAWVEDFDTGRGFTSWVISVAVAVMFGIGPVPAQLALRFGYQAVMFTGGVLSCAGFVMSVFATNVPMLIFTIGIVVGTGCGFCFLPAIAVVSLYFNKRRSLAMGVAAAGAGIGSLVGAQILHFLMETYGWRGAMLIFGGIQLNLVVLSLLMRPLPNESDVTVVIEEVSDESEGEEEVEEMEEGGKEEGEVKLEEEPLVKLEVEPEGNYEEEESKELGEVKHAQDDGEDEGGGDVELLGRIRVNSEAGERRRKMEIRTNSTHLHPPPPGGPMYLQPPHPVMPLSMNPQHRRLLATEGRTAGSLQHLAHPPPAGSRKFASAHDLNLRRRNGSISASMGSRNSSLKHSGNLDIMMAGSMHSLFLINSKVLSYDDSFSHRSLQLDKISSSGSEGDGQSSRENSDRNSILQSCMASIRSNINLMKQTNFLMFLLSNILTNLTFFMPNLFMVDRALSAGLNADVAAILVSVNGAGNVFGRIFFGVLADKQFMQRISWYILVLSICGIATCFSPVCGSSAFLHGLYAFTFGCFIGAYVTLAPCVTVDLVGVEVVGQAYGLALFFMGVSGLIGSPLAGWIYDWTGNYTTSFVVHGFFLFLSAIVLIPVAIKLRKVQKQPHV